MSQAQNKKRSFEEDKEDVSGQVDRIVKWMKQQHRNEYLISRVAVKIAEQDVKLRREKTKEDADARDVLKAIDAIFKLMFSHEAGQTSIIHAPCDSQIQTLVRDCLRKENSNILSTKVRDFVVSMTSQDRLDSLLASLKFIDAAFCCVSKKDKAITVYIDKNHRESITCQEWNYVELEQSVPHSVKNRWVAYTAPNTAA